MDQKEIEDPEISDEDNAIQASDLKLSAALRDKFDSISFDGKREFRCFSNFLSLLCDMLHGSDDDRSELLTKNRDLYSKMAIVLRQFAFRLDENDEVSLHFALVLAKMSEIDRIIIMNDVTDHDPIWNYLKTLQSEFFEKMDLPQDSIQFSLLHYRLVILSNISLDEEMGRKISKYLSIFFPETSNYIQLLEKAIETNHIVGEPMIALLVNISRYETFENILMIDKKEVEDFIAMIIRGFEQSHHEPIRKSCLSLLCNLLLFNFAQDILLDDDMELIPKILLPLAGPTGELYDEEDMAKLPLDLQYLPEGTEIEKNQEIRNNILKCLLLCCNTRLGREKLRENGTYLVLRELHKTESIRPLQKRIEDIVDILIKEESEYDGIDDLLKLKIPNELNSKLDEMDKALLEL
ncbi:protein HGH1 homolog [Brevipalpus obovatus]|uniref:protein HGH1 homolog n=1 Tax=Brevipalpus obovatus TaxID=246614 RepID=UPI003D9E1178